MLFGRMKPGDRLRMEVRKTGRIEGVLVGSRGDSLLVRTDSTQRTVSLGDIDGLWVRRSALVKGIKIGAWTGAIAGGVIGFVQEILLTKRWFNDPPDEYSLGWHLAFMGGWAAMLGSFGVATGAVIGSSHEIWEPRVLPGAVPPAETAPRDLLTDKRAGRDQPTHDGPDRTLRAESGPHGPGTRREGTIGGVTIHGGEGWASTRCNAGRAPFARLNLYATPRPYASFGAEIGWMPPGLERGHGDDPNPGTGRSSVFLATVRGRLLVPKGRIRPLLFASCGLYAWEQAYLGGSAGLGLQCDLHGRLPLVELEWAWHEPLQVLVEPCDPRFFTASLGLQIASW
jgi:hypothetical protein